MSGPEGAEIRYTTDGSDPSAESTLYSSAITLSDTTTVKAIAIKDGTSSSIASQTFTKSSGENGDDY
jgi:chitinase